MAAIDQVTRDITAILGGSKVFGAKIGGPAEMRRHVQRGLPFKALESIAENLSLSEEAMARNLQIAPRTLHRRKGGRLTQVESDYPYRLARIVAKAKSVLGGMDKARAWLSTPNRALGNEIPLQLLDTDIGTRQVEEILGRIDYGVFA